MSSKRECYILSKLFSDFINGLTDTDYDSLINGQAIISLKKKEISSALNGVYNSLLKRLINLEEYELLLKEIDNNQDLKNKADRIRFCKYLNITVLSKDTNLDLNNKIINYILNNKEDILYIINRKEDIVNSFERMAQNLAKIMDEKEARDYIVNCDLLSNKANLIKIASMLDVYVEKDKAYEDIVDIIVSTVVTAKIRSYKIRNKAINNDMPNIEK